jgi:hypothetical protein
MHHESLQAFSGHNFTSALNQWLLLTRFSLTFVTLSLTSSLPERVHRARAQTYIHTQHIG